MELPPLTGQPLQSRPAAATTRPAADTPAEAAMRKAARSFEASFLSEMLQYTGLNEMPSGFGGGAGEQAFGSFLTGEYARLLSEHGGIGIAERVFEILKQRASAE